MNNSKGRLVLYSGASGVGKGSILKKLTERDDRIRVSVSNTTRKPREGEIDGVHYNFVTKEDFERLIAENGFLEYASYCGNYYGTPLAPLARMLSEGCIVFLEIEVQGALQVMERIPGILSIFVLPPSMEELERRLRGRGTEDEETIQKRLKQAREEIPYKTCYRRSVINDDLDRAADEVYDIITNEE